MAVDDPASQPYVVGVGGTTLAPRSEDVWNDSGVNDGAGGGGLSGAWCMPSYQDQAGLRGLIGSDSSTAAGCPSDHLREVPDVSADADPQTGYTIYFTGGDGLVDGWGPIGGTSGAAPLWAAAAALIDGSAFCTDYGSGDPGVLPQGLYSWAAAGIYGFGLSDVTHGNNNYTPSGYRGGRYPSTTGYDMASGIGTPLLTTLDSAGKPSMFYPGLAALMCWDYGTKLDTTHITAVTPNAGPAHRATTVTITGSGFLPITGADEVGIGANLYAASCSKTTRCTAVLPAAAAHTVNLRMNVEDLEESPVTSADRYRFMPAPPVKTIAPSSGNASGEP